MDALPGDPARRPAEPGAWVRSTAVTPRFVADLLTATSRIDAGLAAQAVEHLLTWRQTYKPDNVLVPAALMLVTLAESATWPAVGRLREASLDHLRQRIALPLAPPRDWSRANPIQCTCADCQAVAAFLVNPNQREWRLRAAQDRRAHVEQRIRHTACDLDLTTEKCGRPHTLVAVKNQASYERLARQRRQDLEHLAALGG
jgi:hypothetical protein